MNKLDKETEKSEIELNKKLFEKIVKICLLSGIIFASGFIIFYLLNPESGYVNFTLLNSEKKAENYPTTAKANESIDFYVYIENHLGSTFAYRIKILKGDNQTILNSTGSNNANLNQTSTKMSLEDGQAWTSNKYNISFSTIGENQSIIIELWQYTSDTVEKFYNILWIRLNITA